MRPDLLAWQWSRYSEFHRDRRNLLLHALSWPLFILGCLSVLSTPRVGLPGLVGLVSMIVALGVQGRGHKVEREPPIPFLGAGDLVSRFFVEQWVNFPRFVLSGGFAQAWQQAGANPEAAGR